MQRKTVIAVIVSVAIVIAAILTLRTPEKGTRSGPRPRPVLAFKSADVKALEITAATDNKKETIGLKLTDGNWQVVMPAHYAGDQQTIKNAVEQFDRLNFADVVTENPQRQAELEVDEEKGARIIAKDGAGKTLIDGWLGKAAGGYTMFRPAGKNQIWRADGIFKYQFARDLASWRDHTILEFKADDASKLSVEAQGQRITLERTPAKDKETPGPWKVAESSVKIDTLDNQTAVGVLQTLSSLRAAGFDDAAKPEAVGLVPPRYQITATLKDTTYTLLVGNTQGDDTWVQVPGKPQIYLIQKYNAERLAQAPIDFRDKMLFKLSEADLVGVDVTYGGETYTLRHEGQDTKTWKLSKGTADEVKVKALVSGLEDLKASGFAVDVAAATTGLSKPTATLILRLVQKPAITLKIGALKDDEYYVSVSLRPEVMRLKKYNAERFLKRSSDLTKSSSS